MTSEEAVRGAAKRIEGGSTAEAEARQLLMRTPGYAGAPIGTEDYYWPQAGMWML